MLFAGDKLLEAPLPCFEALLANDRDWTEFDEEGYVKPNFVPKEGKTEPLWGYFSCLGHSWEPTWCQALSQEPLGLPKPEFSMILYPLFRHLGMFFNCFLDISSIMAVVIRLHDLPHRWPLTVLLQRSALPSNSAG